ncbi:hypothetical protein BABINDRAFT_162140 [Babjeviella inositovora NRRL Y-12698]|uniref:Uncharacterized protein n=1 Tax=Babjeviella inositovora NRRL Y-12698 TaxID=984486 RepID=A0A1E3QN58_9ASCO|nr:uncharacterized protein BABINDRAFT_162140 [Babjeviella inositovora NRRL Y-12698]ODQ79070.1 hypothetical protein BABINDRAFT_162140 [Babjeviella inositovora NRRL Y-12698]
MSATRYILGGAAIAGAAYYVYDTNQQRALYGTPLSQQLRNSADTAASKALDGLNTAKNELQSAKYDLQNNLEAAKHDLKGNLNTAVRDIRGNVNSAAEDVTEWTRDKYNELVHALSHATTEEKARLRARYGRKYDEVANASAEERQLVLARLDVSKSPLLQVSDKYIDAVNDIGISTENALQSIKNTVIGAKDTVADTTDAAVSGVVSARDSIVNTVSDAADSVAETKKTWLGASASDRAVVNTEAKTAAAVANAVRGWGDLATYASEELANDHGAVTRDANGKILNWSADKLAEAKSNAEAALAEARSELEAAQKEFKKLTNSWFSSTKEAEAAAQQKLDEAQRKFDHAARSIEPYTRQLVSRAGDGLSYLKSGAEKATEAVRENATGIAKETQRLSKDYIGSASVTDIKEERLAAQTAQALHGWGETAAALAEEEYEEVFQKNDTATGKIWKWAFTNKESAEEAVLYARNELATAKKELDSTHKRWYQFGRSVDTELQQKAQRNYEQAQKGFEHAQAQAKQFTEKANQAFWTGANDAVDQTKEGLDVAHDKAQGGLEGVKQWINK